MKRIAMFLALTAVLVFISSVSNAKNFAYVIGTDGKVTRMETDTDTVVSNSELANAGKYVQSEEKSVQADMLNNRLYVVTGRLLSKVLLYNLSTLAFNRDLGVASPEPDITVFFTPDGKKVFVVWWNPSLQGGAWQFDVFDGTTLDKIKTLDFYFYSKQVTFSKDDGKLFAIENGDKAKITVINMSTLSIAATIDLNTVWRTGVFAHEVEDYRNEKILISETEKASQNEQSRDTLFVYDANSGTSSSRIATGISGDEKLDTTAAKIYVNEKQAVRGQSGNYVKYFKSLGRLHVYDVATAKEAGLVQFTVDKDSSILGIHPGGKKIYLLGSLQGTKNLIVIDTVLFKVIKTIPISNNARFMVFYSE